MVVAISSDNAVWDAVLNNEVVRELRELFYVGECEGCYLLVNEAYVIIIFWNSAAKSHIYQDIIIFHISRDVID